MKRSVGFVAALALVALSACDGKTTSVSVACMTEGDCPGGQVCQEGVCVTAGCISAEECLESGLGVRCAEQACEGHVLAHAAAPPQADEGTIVELDGTASIVLGEGQASYEWIQKEGPQVTLEDASAPKTQFAAPTVTEQVTISFQLLVSLGDETSQTTISLTVSDTNSPPTAALSASPQSVESGGAVALDASASTDPDESDTLTFTWEPSDQVTPREGGLATFEAPVVDAATDLEVSVTVSDGVEQGTASVVIHVLPPTPPGECPVGCEDGNPCTVDSCADGACAHEPAEAPCDDGDACTVDDACSAGKCTGTTVVCNDDNPCTDDVCSAATGCLATPNSAACDDGDPSTVGDTCGDAACQPGPFDPNAAPCSTDADCAELENGDYCDGTLFCDHSLPAPACAVAPSTIVFCGDIGGADPCTKLACDPELGACVSAPLDDLTLCNDGDACTTSDHCTSGVCSGQPGKSCDDGNPCTTDGCDPDLGCTHAAASGPCDDGNPCSKDDACEDGACASGPPDPCDDGNPCTTDSCAALDGCTHEPGPLYCEDGDPCTLDDSCDGVLCVAGIVADCDDGNPCTLDDCTSGIGCQHAVLTATCDDGNACTVGDTCIDGACAPQGQIDCDDGNPCTDDTCMASGGCEHATNLANCTDDDPCTTQDACAAGACVGGPAATCDDANPCTDDSCVAGVGCSHTPNAASCDDANPCTEGDQCDAGACTSGAPLTCAGGDTCSVPWCDPATGCTTLPKSGPCNDGNPCTTSDTCADGTCVGAPVVCDDGNPCTDDSCGASGICTHTLIAGPCDDGKACTTGEACVGDTCVGGVSVSCDDGNICTTDACDPVSGACLHTAVSAPCSDGDACTKGDVCKAGACSAGPTLDCGDGNVCTEDSCSPASGCVHAPVSGSCDDGKPCTTGDTCTAGACKGSGGIDCEDDNPCTDDLCDLAGACTHVPNASVCDDDDVCTGPDACVGGTCIGALDEGSRSSMSDLALQFIEIGRDESCILVVYSGCQESPKTTRSSP